MKLYTRLFAAAALATCLAAPAIAIDGHFRDAVVDKHHKVVLDSKGDCVLTKWQGGHHECANLNREDLVIYFEFNSSNLTAESRMRLDRVAAVLPRAARIESVDIVGYADRIGKSDYNVRLSERRAKAVMDYLAARGYVNARVANVRGLGQTGQERCKGVQGRSALIQCLAPDRRVEIELNYYNHVRP